MQTTTTTTSEATEVATANINQTNESHVQQQQSQSKKQEDSFIRMIYPRSKWSDTMELLGWIFLAIIAYVVSCELLVFCPQYILKRPNDIFLYRYQCVLCFIVVIISCVIASVVVTLSSFMVALAAESVFLSCVKYYYVAGRNSYKWWQKKTNIEFIIFSIMLLIWFVIGFELGNIIFPNTDTKKIVEDRFCYYRVTGLIGIVASYLVFIWSHCANKSLRAGINQELQGKPDKTN